MHERLLREGASGRPPTRHAGTPRPASDEPVASSRPPGDAPHVEARDTETQLSARELEPKRTRVTNGVVGRIPPHAVHIADDLDGHVDVGGRLRTMWMRDVPAVV